MSRDAFEHLQVCEFDWFYFVLLIFTLFWYSSFSSSLGESHQLFFQEVEKERMKNLQERNITSSIMTSKNEAVHSVEKICLDQDKLEKSEKNISEHRQEKVRLNCRAISLDRCQQDHNPKKLCPHSPLHHYSHAPFASRRPKRWRKIKIKMQRKQILLET